MELFRIQDKEGRGPFRPGFSKVWVDDTKDIDHLPPIFSELNIHPLKLREMIPDGMHAGCACKSADELQKWFNRNEQRRLAKLGFSVVRFVPDMVIAETKTQVLFANKMPLSSLPSPDAP